MILASKIGTLIGWLIIIANWIVPFGGQMETILHWSGIGLFAAHVLEMFIYIPTMKKVGGNMALRCLQVIVFGYVHFMEMQEELKQKEA